MILSKNMLLLGVIVLVSLTPAMGVKWGDAVNDEKETRSSLLARCANTLKKYENSSAKDAKERLELCNKRMTALNGKKEQDPLTSDERESLKSLKREKTYSDQSENKVPSNSNSKLEVTQIIPFYVVYLDEKDVFKPLVAPKKELLPTSEFPPLLNFFFLHVTKKPAPIINWHTTLTDAFDNLKKGNQEKARDCFKAALHSNPNQFNMVRVHLAYLAEAERDNQEAFSLLKAYRENKLKNRLGWRFYSHDYHLLFARVSYNLGYYKEALKNFQACDQQKLTTLEKTCMDYAAQDVKARSRVVHRKSSR